MSLGGPTCRYARPTETALADSLRRDPDMGDVMLSCAGETVVGVSGTAKAVVIDDNYWD